MLNQGFEIGCIRSEQGGLGLPRNPGPLLDRFKYTTFLGRATPEDGFGNTTFPGRSATRVYDCCSAHNSVWQITASGQSLSRS